VIDFIVSEYGYNKLIDLDNGKWWYITGNINIPTSGTIISGGGAEHTTIQHTNQNSNSFTIYTKIPLEACRYSTNFQLLWHNNKFYWQIRCTWGTKS
jgi:hypothetical protein